VSNDVKNEDRVQIVKIVYLGPGMLSIIII
jgi:hypothetical protein